MLPAQAPPNIPAVHIASPDITRMGRPARSIGEVKEALINKSQLANLREERKFEREPRRDTILKNTNRWGTISLISSEVILRMNIGASEERNN